MMLIIDKTTQTSKIVLLATLSLASNLIIRTKTR